MESKKHLISLYYPHFLPHLYSDKNSEYHKIWWTIMREKGFKKKSMTIIKLNMMVNHHLE
jgi:predicted SAM-dependent methyltransferase